MKDTEKRIEEVNRIKRFGSDLGIDFGDGFETVDLSRGKWFYWVYTSRKDRIETVLKNGEPSEQFESRAAAKRYETAMLKKGFDTLTFNAALYGGSNVRDGCPITRGLLSRPICYQAYSVLHEGFHNHVSVNNVVIDYTLEEAVADYVGFEGARLYCEIYHHGSLRWLESDLEDRNRFTAFVNKYYASLEKCYRGEGIGGRRILRNARRAAKKSGKHGKTIKKNSKKINNAFFLRYIDYTRHDGLVRDAFKRFSIWQFLENADLMADLLGEIARASPSKRKTLKEMHEELEF